MMHDPIVEEVRKIREAHAAQFNFDLDAIFLDLKRCERESGKKFLRIPRGEKSGAQDAANRGTLGDFDHQEPVTR